MKTEPRRRPMLASLALFVLLASLPATCLALISVGNISKKRAQEMGISVNVRPRDEDVWVRVEFKAEGALQEFRYANLEVTDGEKRLVLAALMPQKLGENRVRLEFYVDPASLPNSTVTIIAYDGPLSGIGYGLRMKDFPPAAVR